MVKRETDDDDRGRTRSWMTGWYGEGYGFFAQRAIRRTARYYAEMADLTGSGIVEPRIWLGAVQRFWSDLAEDYGDYLKVATGLEGAASLIETDESGPPIVRVNVVEGKRTADATISIPLAIWRDDVKEVVLRTSGLSNAKRRVLHPGRHLRFAPAVVKAGSDNRSSKLCFHDLPADLYSPTQLTGVVTGHRRRWHRDDRCDEAEELAPVLLAIVQLRIV